MDNAQRQEESRRGAQHRGAASRAVPSDWFLDPADPDAAEAIGPSLDDQATAFLAAHEALEDLDEQQQADLEAGQPHNVTALHSVPTAPQKQAPSSGVQSIWLGLPGFGDTADDGELAWQADALCAQTDPEAFFPEKGGSTRDAKRVCAQCTVRQECLDYALAHDERFGIWGGMSERERRRLRKKMSS
ncbi:WhiB family transcriptional regulator [Auritidibacter ignavus]|uniref:WhiB family transcriptional regulator n=1 Tax=Auritidibacter ignavus TaxID=678932 RepID=UPI00109CE930|nr:WhiB family transcriptional regulator [Auritidibacter ignavus]